jgi:hypothetical protein
MALSMAGCTRMDQSTDEMAADEAAGQTMQEPKRIEVRQAQPAARTIHVPAGTQITVAMKKTLDSGENQVGDPFTAEVVDDVMIDGRNAIPAGSLVRGEVSAVKAAKRGAGQASMSLAFNAVTLPDDATVTMTASLSEQTESKKGRNAAVIGGSAAGGALLGKMIGNDPKDAVMGAVVGGAIATGAILAQEGEQVKIPRGTQLVIQLDEPMKITL